MITLHDILNSIADKNIEEIDSKEWNKAYDKLITILYSVGNLTNIDANDIIDELDKINSRGAEQ